MNATTRSVACASALMLALGACTTSATRTATAAQPTSTPASTSAPAPTSACAPTFDAANAGGSITNPYYPLPIGRTMVYQGVRDGQKQTDTVTVTSQKKSILGVSATVVTDKADHNGQPLEDTRDYFAQDRQGNVWYLGEDTKSFEPDGTVDTSGSWLSGADGATPGIIMLANPQIPCAYRQEFLKGEAEDTAWIISRGGDVKIPYGTVHNSLRTLEFTVLEPDVIDEKVYAPGLGIVRERSIAGAQETSDLVRVTG